MEPSTSGKMRILLLNPNSSASMTRAMELAAKATPVSDSLRIDTYTAPAPAPASIDDGDGIQASATLVLDDLSETQGLNLDSYDGVLVACFSVHSLVAALSVRCPRLVVTGIFEASILAAMGLVSDAQQWGIVTTGAFWEEHLSDGVADFLGHREIGRNRKFCGVYSTGLTAGDLHTVSPDDVAAKLRAATTRLLLDTANVACVVMGCGGMAGLQDAIRSAAREVYGHDRADDLYIVDGVKAGILQLHGTIHARRTFR